MKYMRLKKNQKSPKMNKIIKRSLKALTEKFKKNNSLKKIYGIFLLIFD